MKNFILLIALFLIAAQVKAAPKKESIDEVFSHKVESYQSDAEKRSLASEDDESSKKDEKAKEKGPAYWDYKAEEDSEATAP